jgi:hypothetical protein
MGAAAPGVIIETELFPGENNLFLKLSGQPKILKQISELLERQRHSIPNLTSALRFFKM